MVVELCIFVGHVGQQDEQAGLVLASVACTFYTLANPHKSIMKARRKQYCPTRIAIEKS